MFISYSHRDEAFCDRLRVHLTMLVREGVIEPWHDRRIVAGAVLDDAISQELETADIYLFLVSPDFLASEYCYQREMARALERHSAGAAKIIPVILRPCEWTRSPLGKLLAVPTDGLPVSKHAHEDDAWLQVVRAIRRVLDETPSNPPKNGRAPKAKPISSQVGHIQAAPSHPRSSNLGVRRTFTDVDRRRFLHEGFAFICRFFEESAQELRARNSDIDAEVRQIDANTFTLRLFRNGREISGCRIYLGGLLRTGIAYSSNPDSGNNVANEEISVAEGSSQLTFDALGMSNFGSGQTKGLSPQGAAELFWAILMKPLQR